jgi:two-component system response regulator
MLPVGMEILLVDGNPEDVALMLHALQRENLAQRTQSVRDGEEALEYLFCRGIFAQRSMDHPPRLIVLDLYLPRIDGTEVLRQLKSDPRTKSIPVVVLAISKHEGDLMNAYEFGANSVVQKPSDVEQFRHLVKQLAHYWLDTNRSPVAYSSGRSAGAAQ